MIYHVFAVQFLGGGHFYRTVLRGAWTQLRQTWRDHRAIITALQFCFRVRILCWIFKRGQFKVEWCWKRRKISQFTPPVKIRGEVGEISGSIMKLHLRRNLRHTFDGHQLCGCWTRCIDKKEKKTKKESSSVKLKAFRHTCRGPNKKSKILSRTTCDNTAALIFVIRVLGETPSSFYTARSLAHVRSYWVAWCVYMECKKTFQRLGLCWMILQCSANPSQAEKKLAAYLKNSFSYSIGWGHITGWLHYYHISVMSKQQPCLLWKISNKFIYFKIILIVHGVHINNSSKSTWDSTYTDTYYKYIKYNRSAKPILVCLMAKCTYKT